MNKKPRKVKVHRRSPIGRFMRVQGKEAKRALIKLFGFEPVMK